MSAYKFVVNTPGQFSTRYGREYSSSHFHGGTLYNDVAISIIWVENQVSLGASETVLGKEHFEKWIWEKACVDISHMHSDNGILVSDKFHFCCDNKHQEQYFYGVVAYNQNAIAERAIQTIVYMARTFIFHPSFHWTYHGSDEISIWSFTVKYVVWLHT